MRIDRVNRFVFVLILQFFVVISYSQPTKLLDKEITFKQLPEELGLNQRSINCILQDSDGYLWIGTWSGLIRCDGNRSEIFLSESKNSNSLLSNKITSLAEDSTGNIWVGTRAHGVFLYDKTKEVFSNYSKKHSKLSSYSNIWDIEFGPDGSLWIATETGLIHININDIDVITVKDGLSDNFVTSVFFDEKGQIWATTENGLNRIDSNTKNINNFYYVLDKENKSLHNYFYECESIMIDGVETLFISSKKGLKEFKNGKLINHISQDGKTGINLFRSIATIQDNKPLVLIGSEVGMLIFNAANKVFEKFYGNSNLEVNLSHNTITDIYIDQSEVLWVGTKKGINKFDTYDKGFKFYTNSLFNPTNSIVTGISGKNGDVFISTMGGGLFKFNQKSEHFTKLSILLNEENDFSDFIQKVYVDYEGYVNVGTAGMGVIRFNPETDIIGNHISNYQSFSKQNSNLSDDYIMSFAGSNDGGIWVGTWSGGLNKIYKNGTHIVYEDSVLMESPIVDILQSPYGLWVGTRGNGLILFKYEGEKFLAPLHFRPNSVNEISSDFISDIYEDKKGRIWVGTEEGLDLYHPKTNTFQTFNSSGLFTKEVISIQEEVDDQFWLTNWNGLSLVKFENNKVQYLHHFDQSDRVQGDFFYNSVTYKDNSGKVYFGGANGMNVIDIKNVVINPFKPKTVISSVAIFNTVLKPGGKLNGRVVISKQIQKTESIELYYDENSILIELASLHFAAPEKNQYQYKLDGFDEDWKFTNQKRPFAYYTNLKDGAYIFRVKSCNNDGIWQNNEHTLQIDILPPWWKTLPAFIVAAILLILLLIGFRYLIITRTRYESHIKYERLERENLKRSNNAQLQFFTNVSHEFRTPLTLILGPLENLAVSEITNKFSKSQFSIIRNNTYRLLRLVNQLLDFRKTETGNMKLKAAEGNFVDFVKEVKLSFDSEAESRNIEFNLHTSSNVINLYYDRDQFEKILFNLLSNSFKHTPIGGKISIKIIDRNNEVDIIVEDNGDGISKKNHDKVFDRFYSNDEGEFSGTGIGLALVKSLVLLHKGTITFDSVVNEKTTFKLTIKKGKEHLNKDDIISDFKIGDAIDNYTSHDSTELLTINEPARDIEEYKTLLVVEDNNEIRAHIRSIFIRDYIILEAANGELGVKLAQEEIPDLIISDVMMPVMDGIKLCKILKTNTITSHIPIILLTARTSLIFKVDGYESGADDYVTKPFDNQLLKTRVANLIKQREKLRKIYAGNQAINIEPSMISFTSVDEKFIKNALKSVENNISNSEYGVEDLGKDVGMSRMQLYRKLKSIIGQSANEFIRTIRLKRAAQLLKTEELTVAEVTYMCGFSDLQYFRQCFRKVFNVNPSEYSEIKEK